MSETSEEKPTAAIEPALVLTAASKLRDGALPPGTDGHNRSVSTRLIFFVLVDRLSTIMKALSQVYYQAGADRT